MSLTCLIHLRWRNLLWRFITLLSSSVTDFARLLFFMKFWVRLGSFFMARGHPGDSVRLLRIHLTFASINDFKKWTPNLYWLFPIDSWTSECLSPSVINEADYTFGGKEETLLLINCHALSKCFFPSPVIRRPCVTFFSICACNYCLLISK